MIVESTLKRARGAIGLGLLWAAGGAVVGGFIELVLNLLPGSDLFLGVDIWPAALAIPGFLAGTLFAIVLSLAEGRRSFDELKLSRLTAWGAVGGLVLGALVGLPWVAVVALSLTSGGSAAASLALARSARQQKFIGQGICPPAPESGGVAPE